MTVKFIPNDKGNPPGKLADIELHFSGGPLDGLKLVGFALWERKSGGRNVTFRAAYVFDLAQTDGEPLPETAEASGDPGSKTESLRAAIVERGITVESVDDLGGALGTSAGGRIQILSGLSAAEEFVVLAHEYAHELLHRADDRPASRDILFRRWLQAAKDFWLSALASDLQCGLVVLRIVLGRLSDNCFDKQHALGFRTQSGIKARLPPASIS